MLKREHYYSGESHGPSFGDWMITLAFVVIMTTPIAGWFIMDEIYKHKKEIKQTEQTIGKKKETKTVKPISIKKTEKISEQEAEKIKKVEELRLLRWEKTTCPHGKADY